MEHIATHHQNRGLKRLQDSEEMPNKKNREINDELLDNSEFVNSFMAAGRVILKDPSTDSFDAGRGIINSTTIDEQESLMEDAVISPDVILKRKIENLNGDLMLASAVLCKLRGKISDKDKMLHDQEEEMKRMKEDILSARMENQDLQRKVLQMNKDEEIHNDNFKSMEVRNKKTVEETT